MPSQVDPRLAAALAAAAEGSAGIPAPAPGDWKALRARANAGQAYLASLIAPSANVTISTCAAAATDGTPVGLRWYTRRGPAPGSAVVYAHGGRPCPGPGIAIAAVHWTCVRETPVTISQAPALERKFCVPRFTNAYYFSRHSYSAIWRIYAVERLLP